MEKESAASIMIFAAAVRTKRVDEDRSLAADWNGFGARKMASSRINLTQPHSQQYSRSLEHCGRNADGNYLPRFYACNLATSDHFLK